MYTVTNCHGVPQCGYETITFEEWEELEAYAEEFAQWAQESGGVPITTDTDAYEPVSKWLDGWEHNDGIEPWAVIHFLLEYGFDTDAAA